MIRISIKIMLIILILSLISCSNNDRESSAIDLETERALAETEAAKQRTIAAEAERKKIEAELMLAKEKERIEIEEAQRLAEEETRINKADSQLRKKLGHDALSIVENSASQILKQAYPLAMNKLNYTSSQLIGAAENEKGYTATVRLNYRNLLKKQHYMDLQFDYDSRGGYRSWKFIKHTDIIAPKELTVGSLLKLIK